MANGAIVGAKKRSNNLPNGSRVLREKVQALEEENQKLREKVDRLMAVNKSQLNRMIDQDLLQTHARELKDKLAKYEKTEPGE